MEKELSIEVRMLLAFAISFVIIMGSRYLLPKPATPPPKKPAAQQAKTETVPPPAAPQEPSPALTALSGQVKQGNAEQEITVEGELYRVVFSTRGAVVKSWSLTKYRDDKNGPLNLIDPAAAKEFGYPLSIWATDESLRNEVNGALFLSTANGVIKAPTTLAFDYSSGHIAVHKEITFPASGYVTDVKTEVTSDGRPVSHMIAWRGGFGDIADLGMRGNVVDVFYRDPQKIIRVGPGDVKAGEISYSGNFPFAGIEDRFFGAAFLPQQSALRLTVFREDITIPGQQKKRPAVGFAVGSGDAPQNHLRFWVGPKDTEVLATVHPQLPEMIDYGWFALVAKPLFQAMRWIHDHLIPNYGWSIIVLTMVINFALLPLKVKSLRSGMKMQKLQPQIKAVQDKYKQYKMKDPKKADMNRELMDLYKKHGVNPLGGCLPMLIQLPFFYGFYRVLVASIEMRHAPWIWWITDLSAPEHIAIRILPLTMCATQFALQRMSPATSPDPTQQKMMMFMPVMFLFIFWSLSSGLVLYWLTGNLVGIAQQWYINRTELQHMVEEKKSLRSGKKQVVARKS